MAKQEIHNSSDLKRDYLLNFDAEFWANRIDAAVEDLDKSDDKRAQATHLMNLYSLYLQAIEVFFINLFAIRKSGDSFIPAIFISNKGLQGKIKKEQKNRHSEIRDFLQYYILPVLVEKRKDTSVASEELRRYQGILEEVIKDYLHDFELLNAYKHGFRVKFRSENSSVGLGLTGREELVKVADMDSTIEYISRRTDPIQKTQTITSSFISFNEYRVVIKARLLGYMLADLILICQHNIEPKDARVTVFLFDIEDMDKWRKSFGSFRYKSPILYGPIE